MHLRIEEVNQSGKILIVSSHHTPIAAVLERAISTYGYEVSYASAIPQQNDHFSAVFIFNYDGLLKKIPMVKTRLIVIFVHCPERANTYALRTVKQPLSNIKVLNIGVELEEKIIEKIFWFSFSQSTELHLNLEKALPQKPVSRGKKKPFTLHKKTIFAYCVGFFLVIELFFILPLGIGSLLLYQSAKALERSDLQDAKRSLTFARPIVRLTKTSYGPARPVIAFLFLALAPDGAVEIQEKSLSVLSNTVAALENSKQLTVLILKKNKTKNEINETATRIRLLKQTVHAISTTLTTLEQKVPDSQPFSKLRKKIKNAVSAVAAGEKLLSHADLLLGKDGKRKYLLLFENNMELRPGGGFIGSFGIAKLSDYTMTSLEVKDVYEADGQLKVHVEPPSPLSTYLHQPHWFLRDSNFSPDFRQNFNQAEFFLEKELKENGFDGAVGITTTGLNAIIAAFGEIYVPDYDEKITSDNFYIKTQTRAEKNFFPGSIQKKSFLSSLTRAIIANFENASIKDVGAAIKQSLDEKHIVISMKDEVFADTADIINWNGKLIAPRCPAAVSSCISDHLFPIDANVGVNKANFFISRLVDVKTKIDTEGIINHTLSMTYKNESPADVFPGGTYKNYFQLYLPRDVAIDEITKNRTLVGGYEMRITDDFTIIGFYFEVAPQKTSIIKINYRLSQTIQKGTNTYQLVIQKQIGSINNDLVLETHIPRTISVVSKNFPALAKDRRFVYNTNLSTDKIFVIELAKE